MVYQYGLDSYFDGDDIEGYADFIGQISDF